MVKGSFWLLAALWILLFPLRWVAGVVLAAAVHELGHLLAIRATGGRVLGLELRASGAEIFTDAMEPGQEILCALAGPLAGSLVMLLWKWFPEAAVASLCQTAFNLLPFYPLDGGRIRRNISCKQHRFRV